MKTNAIIRIIIWSVVLLLLVGILGGELLYRNYSRRGETAAATEVAYAITEPTMGADAVSPKPWEERTNSCDVEATITADALNVRSAPTSSSPAIAMLKKGDVVSINQGIQIGSELELWLSIYAPVEGWIKADYVDSLEGVEFYGSEALRSWSDSTDNTVTASVTAEMNIRSAPSGDSNIVGILQPGDTVSYSRKENVNGEEWAFITSPESGWVMAKYLETTQAVSAESSAGGDISLDPRQIREIDIEWAAGDITIRPAQVDTIQVSESTPSDPKYTMVWKQSNDKLTIRFSEKIGLDFDWGISIGDTISKDLTILVPMGWEFDSLEIAAASATVEVCDLVIGEVDFDGASGVCEFENCTIGELDIDTASGDVYFTGSLDTLDCDAASASVTAVFDNAPRTIEMDSMSGDLDISLHEGVGFTVTMDGLSTDFHSEFGYAQNRDGSYSRGDGKCWINMDAMSGDLYIRKYQEAAAVPETTAATEAPTVSDSSGTHHHTDSCTTDPESCPDNSSHHTEPHHN